MTCAAEYERLYVCVRASSGPRRRMRPALSWRDLLGKLQASDTGVRAPHRAVVSLRPKPARARLSCNPARKQAGFFVRENCQTFALLSSFIGSKGHYRRDSFEASSCRCCMPSRTSNAIVAYTILERRDVPRLRHLAATDTSNGCVRGAPPSIRRNNLDDLRSGVNLFGNLDHCGLSAICGSRT
jgi:hypothetical protein